MKKLYWFFLGLVVLAGITVSIYFGIQPRPIAKIDYSKFNTTDQYAKALVQSLNFEIQNAPVIFIGVMPGERIEFELWAQFLTANSNPGMLYDTVFVESSLPNKELFPGAQTIDLSVGKESFLQGLQKLLADKKRVAFIFPVGAASPYFPESVTSQIQTLFDYPGFTLTTSPFARSAEQEKDLPIPCGKADDPNTNPLGCFIQQQGRLNYRKKNPEKKLEGIVSQVGTKEYLVLINVPR